MAYFPSALLSIISMDYAYSKDGRIDNGANNHLSVISGGASFGFLKTCAWCNSGQRRFEPFAHTTLTFFNDITLLSQEKKTHEED